MNATANDQMWMLWVDGAAAGPYSTNDVRGLLEHGDVTRKTLCQRSGGEWHAVESCLGIMEQDARPVPADPPIIALPEKPQTSIPTNTTNTGMIEPGVIIWLVMALVGSLLMTLSVVLVLFFAFDYKTTATGTDIINMGLVNNRTLGFSAGLAGVVAGAVLFTGGVLIQQMRQGRRD